MVKHVFSAAEIRELGYDPRRFFAMAGSSNGFGYPQQWWRYEAAVAYHAADRNPDAISDSLANALARGKPDGGWKGREIRGLDKLLHSTYVPLDRTSGDVFVRALFERRPAPITWRGHAIVLPIGMEFVGGAGSSLRLIWTAKKNVFGRRGSTLVVAASLAYATARFNAEPDQMHVFSLRDNESRRFAARDLRAMWPRLDQLLTWAEGGLEAPAA